MRTVLLLAITLGLASCSTKKSSDLTTNQITADMHADVDSDPKGSKTEVYVFLKDGLDEVILQDGDDLTAKTEKDPSLRLTKNEFNFYKATLPQVDRTDFTVIFTRANGASAPLSTIKVPGAIALTAPAPNANVKFSDGKLDLAWTNKFDGATASFGVFPCGGAAVSTSQPKGPDTGTFSLSMADLGVSSAPSAPQCVSIKIRRDIKTGMVDPAFKGGTFVGAHSDRIDINVVP